MTPSGDILQETANWMATSIWKKWYGGSILVQLPLVATVLIFLADLTINQLGLPPDGIEAMLIGCSTLPALVVIILPIASLLANRAEDKYRAFAERVMASV